MKILTVIGARPQFVKAAMVSREIKNYKNLKEVVIHTGQHFDKNMSQIFFDEMQMGPPNYNLGIQNLNHGAMLGRMIEQIEKIILIERPDCVLVYGDTNSTLAGALACKKQQTKLIHIEAGLRSFNMNMPEEVNRIVSDRLSDMLFCPTHQSVINLRQEGFDHFPCKIIQSGDVMLDVAWYCSHFSREKSNIIARLGVADGFILCTVHRAENTDNQQRLASIVRSLNRINQEIKVIFPMHPRTKKMIGQFRLKLDINTIDPVGYFDMIELLKGCKLVLTDSGGLQKESYFFKKPCIIFREETEWVELVAENASKLVGYKEDLIYDAYVDFIIKQVEPKRGLYGDGKAAEIIVREIVNG